MVLVLRREKSGPLTSDELDGNFESLEERIRSLEESPTQGEGIAQIIEDGSKVWVLGSYGNDLGSFSRNNYLKIVKEDLPEKGSEGELRIFQSKSDFFLIFYCEGKWRKFNGDEVADYDNH